MKVLITGANGFVGSHITEELIKNGHKVICLVRRTSNLKWLKDLSAEYRYGDITETARIPEFISGADAVVHCAGVLRARRRDAYYRVNCDAVGELAKAALQKKDNVKKIVYISSLAAMGPSSSGTFKKLDERENPISDYGRSKLEGENQLKILEGRIPYNILRPAAVYGPRDKDIFIFFQLVGMGLRPFMTKKRLIQLVYVKDVARAVCETLNRPASDNKTYALGEPTLYSWEEVGRVISQTVNKGTVPVPLFDFVFRAAGLLGETMAGFFGRAAVLNPQKIEEFLQDTWGADASVAENELGLGFTNLKNGAKITYLWYKENGWI
ncbi:MAG: SDR family NAD(P)-dependent oxidoreductase [Endomicrobiales bacterium]|nr:SDR family NAD(P)-dependent oxidoreductase [Endomicrobiales bacterium]